MYAHRWRGAFVAAFALFVLGLPTQGLLAQGNGAGQDGLPLQPARWARFTTSEGTWISLDVSPDGQSIVFDMLGDLYTIPITGGTATRLTDGIAHDMGPRYNPDGSQIVFVSDRSGDDNVWLMAADGSDVRPLCGVVTKAQSFEENCPFPEDVFVSMIE